MKKPRIKCEVAIKEVVKDLYISLNASREAASELSKYGGIHPTGPNEYVLYVDSRFDFDEVVGYIKSYEEADDGP